MLASSSLSTPLSTLKGKTLACDNYYLFLPYQQWISLSLLSLFDGFICLLDLISKYYSPTVVIISIVSPAVILTTNIPPPPATTGAGVSKNYYYSTTTRYY